MAHEQDTAQQKTPSVDRAEGRTTDTGRDPQETHGRDRTGQAADRAGRGREIDDTSNLGPAGDPVEGARNKTGGSPDPTAD